LTLCEDGVALAEKLEHPFTTAVAFWAKGILHQLRREPEQTYQAGTRMLQHSRKSGLPAMQPIGKVFQGNALANNGDCADGISLMRESIAECRSFGALFSVPSFFPTLANAYAATGQFDDGFAAIEEGHALAHLGSDHFNLPELYRAQASLVLARSSQDVQAAEALYRMAIDTAKKQGARLLELRATTDLARLWGENNRRAIAAEMLSPLFASFEEGFEIADLKDAKNLLSALA
jgi:predicted ATPase